MRLKPEQLPSALEKSLLPVYLICGDEPLQLGEAADAVRRCARLAGYGVREVITVDSGNEWPQLAEEADSLSIFADKKVIDLRLPSGKPGAEGSKALLAYCKDLPDETLLLMTCGKLESSAQKSQWFTALDNAGVVVQVWPLQGPELLAWLQRRAGRRGLNLDGEAAKMLASRIEGNLLAAAQEIEKLYVLYGSTRISKAILEEHVADSSRFDVFKLMDVLLIGKLNRAVRILQGLQAEGLAAPVVLWAISRELRTLSGIKAELKQGGPQEAIFKKYQIWDKRRQPVQEALKRLDLPQMQRLLSLSAHADRQIKGQAQGDEWETLFRLCTQFCRPDFVL